ncbi:MAG: hypothetical protein JJU29_15480 [Verrucomicrobia bacterium]|nr:hypothetical protein [Verrucomicrobiota bacterium]MCH8513603.1 DUF6172 family protein [Kiritimatiellia bacterium]
MKKTFVFNPPGKHPERHLEAIKHELRRYLRRENRRELPEGVDYWDFDCRIGESPETAEEIHPSEIIKRVDAAAKSGQSAFYIEILSKPVTRPKKPENTEG